MTDVASGPMGPLWLPLNKLVNTAPTIRAEKERTLVDCVHEYALDGPPCLKLHLNVASRTVWKFHLKPISSCWRQMAVPHGLQFLQHSVKALLEFIAARQGEPGLLPFEVILSVGCAGEAYSKIPALFSATVAV